MKSNEPINLKLSLEEVNLLLSALGQMPYQQVYEMINTLQTQAGQQLEQQENGINAKVK